MTKTINIGMVLDKIFPTDDRVEKEALTLIKAGYNVFLICAKNKSEESGSSDYKGIHLIRIPINHKWLRRWRSLTNTIFNLYPFLWAKYISNFVNDYKIDVLHIHDLYMFKSGLIAKEKLKMNMPIVGDLHENYPDALKYYKFSNTFPLKYLISIKKWYQKEKEWVGQLDYVITVIDEMKQRIAPYCDKAKKIITVQNTVEHISFLDYMPDPVIVKRYTNKFVINYTGRIDYHRGIDTLINSLDYLQDLNDLIIIIVGNDKNADKYKDLVKEKNYQHKVEFVGHQSIGILQNYFAVTDIGVISHIKSQQWDNSSPNKLYHYMLMGKPIISTNCVSVEKILKREKAGLIYQSGNAQELAQKIIKLYNDKYLRESLGSNGKNAVMERLNWEKNSQSLTDLYKSISDDFQL